MPPQIKVYLNASFERWSAKRNTVSRVKTWDGLATSDLAPNKFLHDSHDEKALAEMQRLPRLPSPKKQLKPTSYDQCVKKRPKYLWNEELVIKYTEQVSFE